MTEIEQMIDDCMSRESKLNEWEQGFINDIQHKYNNLTKFQLAKLEEIWERIT